MFIGESLRSNLHTHSVVLALCSLLFGFVYSSSPFTKQVPESPCESKGKWGSWRLKNFFQSSQVVPHTVVELGHKLKSVKTEILIFQKVQNYAFRTCRAFFKECFWGWLSTERVVIEYSNKKRIIKLDGYLYLEAENSQCISVKFLKLKHYPLHYPHKGINLYSHSCILCTSAVYRSVQNCPGGEERLCDRMWFVFSRSPQSRLCTGIHSGKFLEKVFRIKLLKEQPTHILVTWQSPVVKNG